MSPRVSLLISSRDYFVPYVDMMIDASEAIIIENNVNWKRFDISGFLVDDHTLFDAKCKGYRAFKKLTSLEEAISSSDLIISLGYWNIITKKDIERVPLGIVNLHHSHCLKYRGRHCATWAIRNGETVHGTTLHYMNESLDDGPIIDSQTCDIRPDDTAGTLFERVNNVGLRMLYMNIDDILENKVKHVIPAAHPYYTYRAKDLSLEINSTLMDSPKQLYNEVRALTFPNKPKPYILVGNKKITLSLEDVK
jgi:methionyl-tRNA formyltransferase